MGFNGSRHVHFTKMSGAGNDFVVVDNRDGSIADGADFARVICHRRFGVGADGLLLLESSTAADFAMKYYNADGSYGGMCGNGGRCISRFAYETGAVESREIEFEALDYVYRAKLQPEGVCLWMKDPIDFRLQQSIQLSTSLVKFNFVNTGSPHCVIFLDENSHLGDSIEKVDVVGVGTEVRHHALFQPQGANVTFLERKGPSLFHARTYERGVEDETMACGTGAVASALIAHRMRGADRPVRIGVRSGEELRVDFLPQEGGGYHDVTLEGSARVVFQGAVEYNSATHSIVDIC